MILGDLIEQVDCRNSDGAAGELLGVSIDKHFMPSVANVIGTDLTKYKVVTNGRFACNPMHVGRDEVLPISLYSSPENAIVSPAYFTFEVSSDKVLPDYLALLFSSSEFDRRCWFATDASVRGGLSWDALCNIPINLPSVEDQQRVIEQFRAIQNRIDVLKQINDKLAAYAETVCLDFASKIEQQVKLSDLCELVNGRAYSQSELLNEGRYRVLRVGNFFTNNDWYYSDMELEPKKYCDNGDLLICWSASFGAYIWNGEKVIFHYHIWKVDLGKSSPNYRNYLYLYLKHELESLKREGHGSVMVHLTKSGMDNLILPAPTLDELKVFNRKVDPVIDYMRKIQKEIHLNEAIKQELLAQLS